VSGLFSVRRIRLIYRIFGSGRCWVRTSDLCRVNPTQTMLTCPVVLGNAAYLSRICHIEAATEFYLVLVFPSPVAARLLHK
jgi:hypothetical protein